MTILDHLAGLHERFQHVMGEEPKRLFVVADDRIRLEHLQRHDWPLLHLADRMALAGIDAALREMFGVVEVVEGCSTRFE